MGFCTILKYLLTSIAFFDIVIVLMVYYDLPNNGKSIQTPYDRNMKLADGRTLSYADYGDSKGEVILYLHGTPGSRIYPWGDSPLLSQRNIRVITFDRPGFGQSTLNPKFSLSSVVDDIGQLMDHLNVTKFSIFGISGGAPYTYAALYTMPQRIKSAIIISGMGSIFETGKCPDMMKPIFSLYNTSFHLYKGMIWFMRQFIYHLYTFEFDKQFLEMSKENLVPSDAKALEDPKLVNWNNQATCAALQQGSLALAAENALFWQNWGFTLKDIEFQGPLTIWHGEKDINAPPYYAEYACKEITGAKCTFFENEGHLFFWNRESQIYDTLLS